MLETPEQRIKLLKAGFSGKEIERLYIENNNFKMGRNILYEGIEFDIHKLNYQHSYVRIQYYLSH
jgi:hypothetical protein